MRATLKRLKRNEDDEEESEEEEEEEEPEPMDVEENDEEKNKNNGAGKKKKRAAFQVATMDNTQELLTDLISEAKVGRDKSRDGQRIAALLQELTAQLDEGVTKEELKLKLQERAKKYDENKELLETAENTKVDPYATDRECVEISPRVTLKPPSCARFRIDNTTVFQVGEIPLTAATGEGRRNPYFVAWSFLRVS